MVVCVYFAAQLRFHCLIEFALDDCLNRVRDRFTQAMSAQQNIRRDQTLAITAADSDAAGSPTHAAGSHEMRMLGTGRGMMGRVSSFHAVNSFAALVRDVHGDGRGAEGCYAMTGAAALPVAEHRGDVGHHTA